MIKGRMRVGAAWGDICILNVSSRGLLIQASSPQPRGSYVEVRRGHYVIVARVMWTSDLRFGVQTQDPLPVEEIVQGQSVSEIQPQISDVSAAERRSSSRRFEARHDRSKAVSRAIEFVFISLLGGSAALVVFDSAQRALANPLSQVSATLRQH